jgi:predicted nucleic acid-binding protein
VATTFERSWKSGQDSTEFRILQADFDRAIEVMGALALRGRHRVALPDLIIAAVAERGSLIVLHYDDDFERIAAVTGQVMEWVVPKGTV